MTTDLRYDAARAKLRRFLPPPPPDSGWGYSRQRIEAYFLGVKSDDQAALGEAMLKAPATLVREDGDPGTDYTKAAAWANNETLWRFHPSATGAAGAQGEWLDLWGSVLGVPREAGEADALYGPRILSEILQPTTTNYGMAKAIDHGLGVSGAEVLDADTVLTSYRLNSPGLRLNAATTTTTKRLNMAGTGGASNLNACFIVRMPTGAQAPYDENTITRLVNRRKLAGTRLIGIYTATGGAIIAADSVTVGVTVGAYIAPVTGATYAWTIVGGVIDSGAGTNSITYHATAQGPVSLSVVVTVSGGSATYYKPVQAYNALATSITVAEYMQPGTFAATASIPDPGYGLKVAWSATGLKIEGPTNQATVTFVTGLPGTLAVLTASLQNAAGALGTATAQIKILPYPVSYTHTTAALAIGAAELYTVDMGKVWEVIGLTTDYPARVRIYESDAQRTADSGRPAGTDITGTDHGLLFEAVTTNDQLTITLKPDADGVTPLNAAYVSIVNTGLAGAVITATIATNMKER